MKKNDATCDACSIIANDDNHLLPSRKFSGKMLCGSCATAESYPWWDGKTWRQFLDGRPMEIEKSGRVE